MNECEYYYAEYLVKRKNYCNHPLRSNYQLAVWAFDDYLIELVESRVSRKELVFLTEGLLNEARTLLRKRLRRESHITGIGARKLQRIIKSTSV